MLRLPLVPGSHCLLVCTEALRKWRRDPISSKRKRLVVTDVWILPISFDKCASWWEVPVLNFFLSARRECGALLKKKPQAAFGSEILLLNIKADKGDLDDDGWGHSNECSHSTQCFLFCKADQTLSQSPT